MRRHTSSVSTYAAVALGALLLAGSARADTTIGDYEVAPSFTTREIGIDGTDGPDRLFAFGGCAGTCTYTFTRLQSGVVGDLLRNGNNCTPASGAVNVMMCPKSAITERIRATTLGGNDHIELSSTSGVPLIADGGEGADELLAPYAGGSILHGGPGDDTLIDAPTDGYTDQVIGDAGDDTLYFHGDPGDLASGGTGVDTLLAFGNQGGVNELRTFQISLDGVPNDGRTGSGSPQALVLPDVENLMGWISDDVLVGNDAANRLDGLQGNDAITGGGGADVIIGGLGVDAIQARDGVVDTVDCGDGLDSVVADRGDVVTGCEVVDLPALPPVPADGDGDGVLAPADCDDTNPGVRPGAPDVPGNGSDEDCSGADADFPLLDVSIVGFFSVDKAGTRFTRLSVRRVRPGMRVRLRCRGPGCPVRSRSVSVRRSGTLGLTRLLEGKRLRGAAVLEVRVTSPGAVGRVARWTMRRGTAPRRVNLCLRPGAKRPRSCG